jgi:hypothetical protein
MSSKWGLTPFIFLVACASAPENDNFRQVMQRQVGKSADDSDFYPTLYRLKQTNSQRLPNGNVKEEYAAGPKGSCKLSFETTPAERRVVAWSADGDAGDCVIRRPR